MRYAIPILCAFLFLGCRTTYQASYDMSLSEVERPADAEKRFGETEVSKTDTSYVFEDRFIHAVVMPSGGFTGMIIKNKTDNTIRIDWNQGAFVGPDGSSQILVHGEMRKIDIGRDVSSTVIAPNSSVEKIVTGDEEVDGAEKIPTARVSQTSEKTQVKDSLEKDAKSLIGRNFQVVMPFKIKDTVNEYIFRVNINDVSVEEVRQ